MTKHAEAGFQTSRIIFSRSLFAHSVLRALTVGIGFPPFFSLVLLPTSTLFAYTAEASFDSPR